MYSEPKNDLGKTVWLKFEVTNEVTDEKNRKKSSVFKGFRRQGVKNTASRLPVARRSSASADLSAGFIKMPPIWAAFCLRSLGAPSQMGRRTAPAGAFRSAAAACGGSWRGAGAIHLPKHVKSPRGFPRGGSCRAGLPRL